MTGYGRTEGIYGTKKVLAEIRSVNHRFADYNIKVPRHYGFLEDKVRGYISGYISRGKVDVYIAVESYGDSDKQVTLNSALAESYIDALHKIRDEFSLKDDISVSTVARFTDIFLSERKEEDAEAVWQTVLLALAPAVEQFVHMREREGERLRRDMLGKLETIEGLVSVVEERSPQTVKEYRERLEARLRDILADRSLDEQRVITEAAIFADRFGSPGRITYFPISFFPVFM